MQEEQIEIVSEKPVDVESFQHNHTKENARRVRQAQKLKDKRASKKSLYANQLIDWDELMKELDEESSR